ncbi:MAG: O-fucosyltransferase family protein [Bacteroidota bacterium]
MSFQLKRTWRFTRRQAKEVKNQLLGRYPDRKGLYDLYRAVSPAQRPVSLAGKLFPNQNAKLLVYGLTQRGFFSEINNMINAAIYCMDTDTGFVLDTEAFLYKAEKGWEDYFVRFWETPDRSGSQRTFELHYRSDLKLWNRIRAYPYETVHIPDRGLYNAQVFENKRRITARLYQFQPAVRNHIEAQIEEMKLPAGYAACHIRRGDKVGERKGQPESERIEAADYVDCLLQENPEMPALFVCSDSYASIEEIQQYIEARGLDIAVFTTCAPTAIGHSTELLKEKFDNPYDSVLQLLLDVEICARAQHFAGTYSSNMSRFIALRHADASRCFSLDEAWHVG